MLKSALVHALVLALSLGAPALATAQAAPAQKSAAPAASQPPAQGELSGIRNFTRVDATIACAGALPNESMAAVKQAGFRSVVNLRTAAEPGVDVEAAKAAAKEAGINYIWLPFRPAEPDPTVVDRFLQAVVEKDNLPMLIHCASGGRVSMFWAIKRVMVDGWPVDKAMGELPNLSQNVSEPLRAFTRDYLKQRGK